MMDLQPESQDRQVSGEFFFIQIWAYTQDPRIQIKV